MDGEAQVTSSEPANTPAPAEAVTENVSQETITENKPSGFDPVEFTPEQKARVDRIYGNMKRYEGESRTLKEDNQRLIAAFEALQTQQGQIINHIQTNDFKDAESRLTAERQTAWDKGDITAFNKANDGLFEIKAKKVVSDSLPKMTPVEQPKNNGYMNGQRMPVTDAVEQALQRGEIEPQEAQIFKSWESQADDTGVKMRPWTDPSHPLNLAAATEGRAVFENPAFKNKSFADKLREIDRRMGIQTQTSQNNNVLGSGNLTRGNRQPKVELSPQIEKMAIRTKFGGPKAKSDADHVEAYRQAIIRSKAKGGRS